MQIYKTTAGDSHTSYQGSQTEAAKKRKELKPLYAVKPISQTIEVPTNKAGLLAWLNENVTS